MVEHKYFGSHTEFEDMLAGNAAAKQACYLQPLSDNFYPTFDAFMYLPDIGLPDLQPLIGLQMTDTHDHSVSFKGLQLLQKSLSIRPSALKDLRPSAEKKQIILFVVPDSNEPAFLKQTLKDGKDSPWTSKSAQYVLGLGDTVWGSLP